MNCNNVTMYSCIIVQKHSSNTASLWQFRMTYLNLLKRDCFQTDSDLKGKRSNLYGMEPSIIKVIVKSKSPFATLAAIQLMNILSIHHNSGKKPHFYLGN